MTTKTNGPAAWNLNKPEEKTKLTAEAINKKSHDIAREFQGLFVAYGLACNQLAAKGDVLGLTCFANAAKQLLANAVSMCIASVDAEDIIE